MAQAPSVYITSPVANEIVSGNVAIGVAITGDYSGPADLYYTEGKGPKDWILLAHSDAVEETDSFFVWETDTLTGYLKSTVLSTSPLARAVMTYCL